MVQDDNVHWTTAGFVGLAGSVKVSIAVSVKSLLGRRSVGVESVLLNAPCGLAAIVGPFS